MARRARRRARHGLTGYRNDRCRCEVCRSANNDRVKAQRLARMGQPIPPHIHHGTLPCYKSYGCRCEPCREAGRIENRRLSDQRKARILKGGHGE